MTKHPKIPPTFKLTGNADEAGHDEHILVLNDIGAAIVLAGLQVLVNYESHMLDKEEMAVIKNMSDAIRQGLADGVENRKKVTLL